MSAPTAAEIRDVEAGVNDRLALAALEPRDPDELVRALQDDRDRAAYRGDFDRAETLDARVLELRHPRLELDDEELAL